MNWMYNNKEIKSHKDIPKQAKAMVYVISYEDGYKYIGSKLLRSTQEKPALKNGSKRENHIKFQGRNVKGKRVQKEIIAIDKPFVKYMGSSDNTADYKPVSKRILMFTESMKQSRYWENYYLYKHEVLSNDMFLNKNISGTFFENDDNFIKEL